MTVIRSNPYANPRGDLGANGAVSGRPVMPSAPQQVLGFNPLTDCSPASCRYWNADCCYKIPVFAEAATTSPDTAPADWDMYKNDQSAFLLSFPSYTTGATNTSGISIVLQKDVNGTWTNTASLQNNTLGTYYPFYSLAIYYYIGVRIFWRRVLNTHGEGCYRVYVTFNVNGREGCKTSEPYQLREFSCKKAHGTVRMDARMYDGSIANIDIDGWRDSLCEIAWYDSIRFHGFFGYEKSDEEKRQIELRDGKILKMRDELVQKFELITSPLPKWFHDRFKAYGTMSEELKVSDYNWNNSDYNLNRKLIVREGGYAPEYKIGSRLSIVKVTFMEGYQNVSRSLCCGGTYTIR